LKNLSKLWTPFSWVAAVVVLIQSASLFRSFPSNPACGRVLNVFANLNVLINCDSAVFMKDAQSPSRLFDGESVYQDRPAHALFVWVMSNILKVVGFPNSSREIVGNSGETTLYQSAFYLSYLVINLLILLVAVKLAINYVYPDNHTRKTYSNASSVLLIIFLVAGNELTKTFFWTPHSQMFNVLLPVLALVLISNREKIRTFKVFLSLTVGLVFLMFFYPLFGLLLTILISGSYSKIWNRALIVSTVLSGYLLYPRVLEYLGGSYSNYAILKFRQYVWILDASKQDMLRERSIANINLFISTIPLIPTLLIVTSIILLFIVASKIDKRSVNFRSEFLPYLLFFAVYIFSVLAMGYYSRRLTLGPFIFLELFLLRNMILISKDRFQKVRMFATNGVLLLLIGSWLGTNGPLS
jgi:hypothetical protein